MEEKREQQIDDITDDGVEFITRYFIEEGAKILTGKEIYILEGKSENVGKENDNLNCYLAMNWNKKSVIRLSYWLTKYLSKVNTIFSKQIFLHFIPIWIGKTKSAI